MNPPDTKLRQDAEKKRREYLRTKASLFGVGVFSVTVALISGPITLLFVLLNLLACMGIRAALTDYVTENNHQFAMGASIAILAGYFTYAGFRELRSASNRSKKIPYVPPVAEQLAALPPEDILVRGSNQPSTASHELLKAVNTGAETMKEELLRVNPRAMQ